MGSRPNERPSEVGKQMILSWKTPIHYNEKLIGSYDARIGSYEASCSNFDYLALLEGRPYPRGMDRLPVFFQCNAQTLLKLDCLWLLVGIPLISERLANFLSAQAPTDIELIEPRHLVADHQDIAQRFYMINASRSVEAIDHARSEAERDDDGYIIYFNQTWFLDAPSEMGRIAREPQSGDLLISAGLADLMIDSGFRGDTGLGFFRAERRFMPYRGHA
ncbi:MULTISPECIES: imm11 family protein [Stenotrophomonas]|uniref:imm11 family protein n=1 Tax=Stenotrophomonas TaxID=40323 RepID=UPI0007B2F491|nr:DUF1629 domain-containing protein [Stenotrophomonas sp. PvP093]KZE50290.1 hypothetical protein AVW14_12785 [Stenotrophomonas maltophilia]MBP2479808.1 hypothetical protein [Stenotrophomonas sp. PvP093]MCF3547628.1 hypothetical protein [Stenotrophomonas maltophilia]TNY01390.1 hypothetical protein FIU09_05640 [Stenotrophomonas maltophilia]TPD77814.1 hypothetical protein FJN21_10295 [Stenotrophomonas maltophilia]